MTKRFIQMIAVIAIASFFLLAMVESFHHHENPEAQTHCVLCLVANHTPALLDSREAIPAPISIRKVVLVNTVPVGLQWIAPSLGRSPPAR